MYLKQKSVQDSVWSPELRCSAVFCFRDSLILDLCSGIWITASVQQKPPLYYEDGVEVTIEPTQRVFVKCTRQMLDVTKHGSTKSVLSHEMSSLWERVCMHTRTGVWKENSFWNPSLRILKSSINQFEIWTVNVRG